jgi:3-keto-5-aminohexanoate cleavage enzyme
MDKLIVTVAPTSNFHGKDANPALPFSPQEAADAVYACWNEGASIVHLHGRDEKGLPTNNPSFFQEADRLIREKKCNIIIQHSMAPANPNLLGQDIANIDDGVRTSTTKPPPEMVSLEIAPVITVWKGKAIPHHWNRLWAENVARGLLEKGIKPEIEIYNNGQMDDLNYLIEKEVIRKPYYISFVMNMHRVGSGFMRYSPKHVMHLVDLLPSESRFTVLGIGCPTEFEATTLSILLGGNVRVGFEDNIYIEQGKLAKSNTELVAKIVRIARDLGREIASPDEARAMLGIPRLNQ